MVGGFLACSVIIAIVAALAQAQAQQTCYHPDRTVASNSVPCGDSNEGTFCCGNDAICLSNGYCLSATTQPYGLYRGSCTDSGWGSFCAYYCVNFRTGDDAPIIGVGINSDGRAIYCCGYQDAHNATTCSNGDAPFVLEDGDLIFGRAGLVDATLSNSSSSPTTGAVAGPSTADTSSGSGTPSSSSTDCSSSNTAIGAGVGVPLGVLALAGIAWGLWERNKRRKMAVSPAGQERGDAAPIPMKHVYMPPQRTGSPTELEESSMGTGSPQSLLHNNSILEMMGSEGRRD